MKIYPCLIFIIAFLLSSCNQSTEYLEMDNNCPCDSIGTFKRKGKDVTYCNIGKSQISIKSEDDTVEVTRFYTEDSIWHIQEYLIMVKDKIIYPEYAMYCDFKDSLDYYKLSFIKDETSRNIGTEPIIDTLMGVEVIVNSDTIKSNSISVCVPKEIFYGTVQLKKKVGGIYKGERGFKTSTMYLVAEELIKYGRLDKQYILINEHCKDQF